MILHILVNIFVDIPFHLHNNCQNYCNLKDFHYSQKNDDYNLQIIGAKKYPDRVEKIIAIKIFLVYTYRL